MKSTSSLFSFNKIDVLKSIRTALMTAVSTFATAAIMAGQTQITSGMFDSKQLGATCLIAGLTAVLDLVRRSLTDYTK